MSLLLDPWLKLVGAILLLWIGIKLIAGDKGNQRGVKASDRLFTAVSTILVADLVMSLDNVMAVAAAAKGDVRLIVFGLGLSIPIVVAASQVIVPLLGASRCLFTWAAACSGILPARWPSGTR